MALNTDRTAATRSTLLSTIDNSSVAPDASEGIDARMLQIRFRQWIGEMPDRRREAFQLSRFDELSYAEIARIMGLSVRTVERHIQLALKELRDRVREFEPTLLLP